ncbi:MAG: hypothetical protein H0U72_07475 [Nitrosospira sp.]|nr:hypothetical protein [Nitrosospira sp.]
MANPPSEGQVFLDEFNVRTALGQFHHHATLAHESKQPFQLPFRVLVEAA